jgi:hypothetical protein
MCASARRARLSVQLCRQVQREVHRHVLRACGDGQAGRNLAIPNLAEGARILSLHAHGVCALLWKAGVVDDPVRDRPTGCHRRQRVACGLPAHVPVRPFRASGEIRQPLVGSIDKLRVRASSRCHRLRTLPLPVAHQAYGVRGKRCALGCRPQNSADPVEVCGQSALSIAIKQVFHPHDVADFSADWQLFQSVVGPFLMPSPQWGAKIQLGAQPP